VRKANTTRKNTKSRNPFNPMQSMISTTSPTVTIREKPDNVWKTVIGENHTFVPRQAM
jgi:hypothetical protein